MTTPGARGAPMRPAPYLVLTPADYRVLGPAEFGMPGLRAVEALGPFVDVQAAGPLITVHDSTIEPRLGIGHHPHRFNERLFYIMEGQLDHDDALNGIQGHMDPGDTGLFTEGQRGMLHSEWNHGDVPTRAYILVYTTDPVPEETAFTVLKDAETPRYQEGEGVHTKEVVGPRSPLRVHGDLRLFTDSRLEDGRSLTVVLDEGEGALLSVREGRVRLDGRDVGGQETILVPPDQGARTLTVTAAGPARVLRAVFGPGFGLVRRGRSR
ncbi:MAG TPA: pirin family protein [Dehalococcoidia bacterium]